MIDAESRQAVAQTEERPLWEREAAGSTPASLTPIFSPLDAGIASVVHLLRRHGFDTCDSGDGKKRGPGTIPRPHVVCLVAKAGLLAESDRLWALINRHPRAIGRAEIEATYSPVDGVATIMLTGVRNEDLDA